MASYALAEHVRQASALLVRKEHDPKIPKDQPPVNCDENILGLNVSVNRSFACGCEQHLRQEA